MFNGSTSLRFGNLSRNIFNQCEIDQIQLMNTTFNNFKPTTSVMNYGNLLDFLPCNCLLPMQTD